METRSKKVIKTLFQLSPTVEEADKVINENYNFKRIREKLTFLKEMFDVYLINKHDADEVSEKKSAKMGYWAILNAIIIT